MEEIRSQVTEQECTLQLVGRIDSTNAPAVEEEAVRMLAEAQGKKLVVDAADLEYISSAGLRMLLHLRKEHPEISIMNVSSDVYEVLEMTGFTQMMSVAKAYRVVSVEGCEEIGRGANGTIYRIDKDNVVKVYNNADALEDIQHEREVARTALVLGIPTAISYDVVRVGESYGSVFELLNAESFSEIIAKEPDKRDWCVKEYVGLLKKIHGTEVPPGKLPSMHDTAAHWLDRMAGALPAASEEKLRALFDAIPEDDHMIHGDYHTKNVVLADNEVLLIDMDTLAVGHPIYEFGSMFNAFVGFSEMDHTVIERFQGFDFETANEFWKKSLAAYLGTDDAATIASLEDKARIIGYTRLIGRAMRLGDHETEEGRPAFEHWKEALIALIDRTDSLLFDIDAAKEEKNGAVAELDIEATVDNLPQVISFIASHLEKADCPPKAQMQIDLAVEEIFVNIAHYAYHPETGNAIVRVEVTEDPISASITFIDHGTPYDPLAKEDPDVTLAAEERDIGGLGIFLSKQLMDDVIYEYKDGQNILTLKKNL